MSLQPRIRRLLVPPASIPTKTTVVTALNVGQLDAVNHIATHQAKKDVGATITRGGASAAQNNAVILQRHVTQHAIQPLVAYVLEQSNNALLSHNKVLVVQNYTTQEIVWSVHWHDVATLVIGGGLSGETTKSHIAAVKALGTIQSLQFYDASVVYWSRLSSGNSSSNSNSNNNSSLGVHTSTENGAAIPEVQPSMSLPGEGKWSSLVVQTDKRILLLNLQRGAQAGQTLFTSHALEETVLPQNPTTNHHPLALIQAHLYEKTVGAVPSSNVLPVVNSKWLLVGCADGSLKCFDWRSGTVFKKIKGLGKGDCVTHLLAAHPYHDATGTAGSTNTESASSISTSSTTTTTMRRRILTVTKKGLVYLMEVTMDSSTASASTSTKGGNMDLQPPLARFQIPIESNSDSLSSGMASADSSRDGSSSTSASSSTSMEHCTYSYDAHMDRFLWLALTSKGPVVYVWNLKAFSHHSGGGVGSAGSAIDQSIATASKSLLKPEPTLIVQFPTVSSAMSTLSSNNNPLLGGLGLSTPNKDDASSHVASNPSGTTGPQSATATATTTSGGGVLMTSTNTASSQAVTVATGLVHAAFSEETVVSIAVTATGDICLHGAVALAANTTSSVQATPCLGLHLKSALIAAIPSLASPDSDALAALIDQAELRVHAVTHCPLQAMGVGTVVLVATNWGLVVLEWPVYSNSAVQAKSVVTASRHLHFGAGLGSLGKSILTAQQSTIKYGSLDVLTANPVGWLEAKNAVRLYDSPAATHMPTEYSKRPFRCAPLFLQSPTGTYIGVFWPCEFRYEVLHAATLLAQIGQLRTVGGANNSSGGRNVVVASGTGVSDFGWVSDEDVFAILHAPEWQEQAALQVPKQGEESDSGNYNLMSPNLKLIGAGAMGVANLATSVTKTATHATLSATKLATSAAVNTTMTVTKGATTAANKTVGVTTKAIRSGAKGVTMGVKKSFGIFKKKRADNSSTEGSIVTAADDDDDDEESTAAATVAAKNAAMLALQGLSATELEALRTPSKSALTNAKKQRYVELKRLDAVEAQAAELSTGIPMATCTSLGPLTLRGGNRGAPTVLYGGPVLCVATRSEDDKEGHAHFYTSKASSSSVNGSATDAESNGLASTYQSSGPTLPYPDIVAWDDDGRLCAIVVDNRIAIYLSNEPLFELIGSVRISSPSVPTAEILSIKFVHCALFCCTWNSVHCVLLGDLEGGICRLDTYLLASTDIPAMTVEGHDCSACYGSLAPTPLLLPLVQPSILGYHSGSLLVSTLRGVQAIPLQSPLMRIGLLLSAGQTERAMKWLDAIPNGDYETLAAFLERRGYPDMALTLPGLSLETIVDMSMRYGHVDRLEDVVETFGVGGLHAIDMGRGVASSILGAESNGHSVLVCVGAYLLAHGRVELTRRLATECLRYSGEQGSGKKDAFLLGSLLLAVDKADATRLIQRAVVSSGGADDHTNGGSSNAATDDWLMGEYARNYVLASAPK